MSGTVGIDVGGTYTDLYFSGDDGRLERVVKVPSTPKDPSIGLLDALHAAEINKLIGKVERSGYTLVPINLHFLKGRAGILLSQPNSGHAVLADHPAPQGVV